MLTLQRQLLFSLQFFRKYLTPEERADVIMVPMEAMTRASRHDVCAASKMLKMILKHPMPEIGKVPALRDLMVQGQLKDSSTLFWILFCLICYWLGFKELQSFSPEEKQLKEELFAIVWKAIPLEKVTSQSPLLPEREEFGASTTMTSLDGKAKPYLEDRNHFTDE